jgi:hypothetical protein
VWAGARCSFTSSLCGEGACRERREPHLQLFNDLVDGSLIVFVQQQNEGGAVCQPRQKVLLPPVPPELAMPTDHT